MADKEATVYIVDVGKSMGQIQHGRHESDLDWAMKYVWDKIASTVSYVDQFSRLGLIEKVETGRKTAMLGVVGLKTDGTHNELSRDESYEHITVWQEISQILMPELRNLRRVMKPSKTDAGDAVSAIVIAVQMIIKQCKKLKYRRKIVLVTNALGPLDMDSTDEIAKKVKEYEIELVVLGVDFDDDEFGFKEEGKSQTKRNNESLLRQLVDKCDGLYGTLAEAIAELDQPRVKRVNPVPTFRGQLMLGDPEHFETAISIDVERYARTFKATPPSASNFVMRSDIERGQNGTSSSETAALTGQNPWDAQNNENSLTTVRNARTYQVDDEDEPGKKKDVDREELAKGYEYGRTAVHISESDENITKLETNAGVEILGFVLKDRYERYMNMSQANVIIGAKTNAEAALALSSFIHALYELDFYAVARVVKKDGQDPLLILLAPSIETQPDYECLIEVQLPFAEDVRSYRFPPLDKVVTVSGKILTEHRNLPSDKLTSTMSEYIDQLDLSTFGRDDEGQPTEYMAMEDTFSPMIHRLSQAIRWRATHPTEPIPPPSDIILRYSTQPDDLQEQAGPALQKLVKAADVKKVPPKVRGRKRNREVDKPLSGLNVDELLHREKRFKISPDNAIPEFKQMLASTEDMDTVRDAVSQMTTIIESQIKHSMGDNDYGRAVEALGVIRSELIGFEEPDLYNDMVRGLKDKLLGGSLGGDRDEMWYYLRNNRLGLITKKQSSVSAVTEEDAKTFLWKK